jgi:hypothetical protein
MSLLAMKSYNPNWLIKVNEIWYWRILNVIWKFCEKLWTSTFFIQIQYF